MSDVWVADGDGSYFNLTRHLDLVEAGLVPLDTTHNSVPVPGAQIERRHTVPKSKTSGLAGLSKVALRRKLLATVQIPDGAWNAAYGAPERYKGETREAYIKRVLRA